LVYQPSALIGIDKLLSQIPIEDWKAYLHWHLLSDFAPYLHKAFVEENFKFYGNQLSGLAQNTPLEKRAINLVNGTLGEALGAIYVKHYFSADSKKQIDKLVHNLKQSFKLNLENNSWMTEKTKQAALLKLSKMTTKIGYPDTWKTYEGLQIKNNTLVENIINSNIYELNRELQKLNKPVDRNEWQILPQTINAYYSPNMNEIVFPAAILQPPLFDSHASDAQNYGAIGAVIGHEISHAFDDQGRKFDGDGHLKDWWTAEDVNNFQAYTKTLVKQYSQYEPIKGIHLNGELTLGENIADISGLSVAYHAFQLAQKHNTQNNIKNYKSNTNTSTSSTSTLSDNQLFFISWAQTWKNKIRHEALQQRLITDPHSPGAYRADGVVKNIDAFYQAFNVQPSDKMYIAPNERVNLWSFLDKQTL